MSRLYGFYMYASMDLKLMKRQWISLFLIWLSISSSKCFGLPIVITTWNFTEATNVAWRSLVNGGSAIDAVEAGCSECEDLQCDHTVGYGGSPDEFGETTLDALIFDGDTMNMGAVAGLRRIKKANSLARKVLENTHHSIIAGDLATEFGKQMGFQEEDISTPFSLNIYRKWKENQCQPNFWTDVTPDPSLTCGPYKPLKPISSIVKLNHNRHIGVENHDTISMVVIDKNGSIVVGTSSNGANHKIPGRIGDAPIAGAGAYADSKVGAGVATGDGDVMMRFLPSSTMVEMMRNGVSPKDAARKLIIRIGKYYPNYKGALIAVNKKGDYSASCHGINEFPYSLIKQGTSTVIVENVKCVDA